MSVFDGIALPKVIYRTKSEKSGEIEVSQEGSVRRLRVDRVTQSLNADSKMAHRMVWGRAIALLKQELPDARSVLILGMGGGTMGHYAAQTFPNIQIVDVEFDPVIVQVAKDYFDVDKIPNHKIITADACRVIVEPEEYDLKFSSFDAVIVDIFVGSAYPDLGKSGNFLAHICKMAVPGGIVIINRIYLEDFQEDVDIFIDTLSAFLTDTKTLIIPGKTNADNMLIFGRVRG